MYARITRWSRLDQRERGATAMEYGMVVGLLSVALVVALMVLGPKVGALITTAAALLP